MKRTTSGDSVDTAVSVASASTRASDDEVHSASSDSSSDASMSLRELWEAHRTKLILMLTGLIAYGVMAFTEYIIDLEALNGLDMFSDQGLFWLVIGLVVCAHLHMATEVVYKANFRFFQSEGEGDNQDSARKFMKGLAWLEVASRVVMTWALVYLLTGGGDEFFIAAPFLMILHAFYIQFYHVQIEANYAPDGYEPEMGTKQEVGLFMGLSAIPAAFQILLVLSCCPIGEATTILALVAVVIGLAGAVANLYLNQQSDSDAGSTSGKGLESAEVKPTPTPKRQPLTKLGYFGLGLVLADMVLYFLVTNDQGSYDSIGDYTDGNVQDAALILYAATFIISVMWLYVSALRRQYTVGELFDAEDFLPGLDEKLSKVVIQP